MMEYVSALLNDLGAIVVLPVMISIFGVVLGQKLTKALRSGLLVGVGCWAPRFLSLWGADRDTFCVAT